MPSSEYSKDTDRTTDVQTHDQEPFHTYVNVFDHPEILQGLTDCEFTNASPIQVAALPKIIAGNDTIVEAKNGTGKTLTFVIPTLMRLNKERKHLQTIVLAPTREIAVQIQQCFKKVGQHLSDLKCEYFIGGTQFDIDKKKADGCQIAVGSPGRIKHLLNEHVLIGSSVKSFILDEVDRLFSDKNFIKDVRLIDAKLPKLKQMIFVSASIDKNNMSLFDEFMKEYTVVKGGEEDMNASQDPSKFLLGIKQYVACVKAVSTNIILLPAKNVRLLNILQNMPYTQCIIFTNYMTRVEAVCNMLRDHHYKADYIRGDQDQNIRLKLVDRLTSFKSKILVATDLIARGINSSNVDLVINMDCPNDWATYLHRIGRAGRFGNKGNAFTILDDDKELNSFKCIINSIENVNIKMLPIAIKKPIPDYADDELEDLNLTVESDVSTNENKNNIKEENGNNVEEENVKENENNVTEKSENNIVEENGNNVEEENVKENENNVTEKSENNIVEENRPSNTELKHSDIDLKITNLSLESKPKEKTKPIYEPGVSEEEVIENLCQVVKETEKKLIDDNLINKKLLSADRTFVLFDPVPFLDDSDQYSKYSPREIAEIMTVYNSNFEKYEAAKKLMPEKCFLQKVDVVCSEKNNSSANSEINNTNTDQESCQNSLQIDCQEKQSTNEVCSEKNCSSDSGINDLNTDQESSCQNSLQIDCQEKQSNNEVCSENISLDESNNPVDTGDCTNTSQRPRFNNIYDLFQLPDFTLLKTAQHNKTNAHSTNEHSMDEDESENISSTRCEKGDSDEYFDEDEFYDAEIEECLEEEYEEENEHEEEIENEHEEESEYEHEEESENEHEEESEYEHEEEDEDFESMSIDLDVENESSDEGIVNEINKNDKLNKHSMKHSNTLIPKCNIQKNNVASQSVTNKIENKEQQDLVDYDVMNVWYQQWKQQMSVIQRCVKMSK